MSDPSVYVLVINWNGLEHLDICFQSLISSSYPNTKFVLVDNASEDGSVEFVRERFGTDARVEILECGANLGWSRGNNVGIEHALANKAEYILLLNNDTETDSEAIATLVRLAESDTTIGALSPKLLLFDHPELLNSLGLVASRSGAAWDIGIGRADLPRWNAHLEIAGVCGAAMFLRASVLEKTSLLPTDFDIYLDDLDLCLRIWNAGYRILTCPEARVKHKFSATMGTGSAARRKYYLNTRNRARILLRNLSGIHMLEALLHYNFAECRAIGRALLQGEFWRVWAHIRAWAAAVAYIPNALRHRQEMRRRGIEKCRFWNMTQSTPLFFPGTEFPENGWYLEREISGRPFRPMAPRATYEHGGGAIRICLTQPYPALGGQSVEVTQDGQYLTHLHSNDDREWRFDWSEGQLVFEGESLFTAEQTGEPFDIAAWIHIEARK